jgi:hypothetical protein
MLALNPWQRLIPMMSNDNSPSKGSIGSVTKRKLSDWVMMLTSLYELEDIRLACIVGLTGLGLFY